MEGTALTETITHVSAIAGLRGEDARRVARYQLEEILAVFRDLTDEEWEMESDCEGWTVHDVAAHLLGWAEAVLSPPKLVRQLLASQRLRKEKGNVTDASNHLQVEARRAIPHGELLARMEIVLPRMLRRRSSLARFARYVPYYDGFLGTTNVGFIMNAIFSRDTFMHRADISRPLGREMVLGDDDRRLLEDVVRDWARRSDARLMLHLTGPAGGDYLTSSDAAADVTVGAVDFGRILTRRESPEIAQITGDRDAALGWLRVFTPF
ncbi:MAG: maleylpyruvate isomerase family mycothiol-dependent enzyme [Actinobacteria bacterium]|nr:maleylpyruvate isomerase family mycothiol-dependent enzyme [Actinomycetota bacterium]